MHLLRSQTIRTSVVSGTVGALVAGGVAWAVASQSGSRSALPVAQAYSAKATPVSGPKSVTRDVTSIVAKAVHSVVSVKATKVTPTSNAGPFGRLPFGLGLPLPQREQEGVGSGVVVKPDGVILTNNHVVDGAKEITVVTSEGREYTAKVVGTDSKTDLAVLRINLGNDRLQALPLGDSESLRLGEPVLAIGNPFGVGQTVTQGIVSAKGRADLGINAYEDFIQTDAAINPGNSGGALVNLSGELVGINTAILSRSGGNMGIGFAIPTKMAKPIMQSLLKTGHVDRGWLGVAIQDVDKDMAEALGLGGTRGVLVADVEASSPAEKAAMKRGDVVLSVNGTPTETVGQLRNAIALAGSTQSVKLAVWRNSKRMTLDVKLGSLPEDETTGSTNRGAEGTDATHLDGARLSDFSPAWRERLQLPSGIDHGVVVMAVEPGSVADKAGLKSGDLILELDRKSVEGLKSLATVWQGSNRDKHLLLVQRGEHKLYLVAKE